MRPDEHKKKKNTAYKKKHGITTEAKDDKTKRDLETSARSSKNELPQKGVQTKATNKPTDLLSSKMLVTSSSSGVKTKIENKYSVSSSSSDEEAEISSKRKPHKSFKRREIVSNWQKYELHPSEEENLSTRGENYEKLLSMAGESISHFRFKDELAWDDPADTTNEKSSDAYSGFLCVDPANLAQSLACLPVYQVLGVSQDVFTDDQLSSMASLVKDRRSVYAAEELLKEKEHDTTAAGKDASIEDSKLPSTHEDDKLSDLLSLLKLKIHHTESYPDPLYEKIVGAISSLVAQDASVSTRDDYPDSDVVSKEVFTPDSNLLVMGERLRLRDDDLDELLASDHPKADIDVDTTRASRIEPPIADSLPNSDTSSTPSQPKTANLVSKTATDSSELEDWLDSILDD